jgi:hypothetical protein
MCPKADCKGRAEGHFRTRSEPTNSSVPGNPRREYVICGIVGTTATVGAAAVGGCFQNLGVGIPTFGAVHEVVPALGLLGPFCNAWLLDGNYE